MGRKDKKWYHAYGNQSDIAAADTNPFRYSGEYYDSETGFIYLRARYYDSTTGTFISEDPARDGANWYAYCAGNPVMFVDPSGLDPVPQWAINILNHSATEEDYAKALRIAEQGKSGEWIGSAGYKVERAIYLAKNRDSHAVNIPSKEVVEFLKNYENCSLKVYDSNGEGDWTIGWGHKTNASAKPITQVQADELFEADLDKTINTTLIPFLTKNNISLTQNQFDAMVSFTYNFGEYSWGANGYETMKNFLIAGDYSEKATRKEFAMYMGSKAEDGHIARRHDEIEMFLYGDYNRDYNYTRP